MTTTPSNPLAGPPPSARPECSLIMKGGITSGVIYPRLASRLAQDYRLRSIGGSSAGAIAAGAAAVAELRRVRDGSDDGFDRLDTLPDLLNEIVAGRSRLLSLFRPAPRTEPLFGVLLGILDAQQKAKATSRKGESTKPTTAALVLAAVRALVTGYPVPAVAGALPGLALIVWAAFVGGQALAIGLVGGLVLLTVGLVVALALAVKRTLLVDVQANNFGLCSGSGGPADAPALTDWLHAYLQEMAHQADPVTFGDLAGHGIEVAMMTTNLTQGRPMAMPWTEGGFFFDPAVWRTLFPADVVAWLLAHPPDAPAQPAASARYHKLVTQAQAQGLAPLPDHDHLPLVVAVRMSLSFPVLISAIPLWAYDWSPRQVRFRTNWFTDGGLCANLPVHFFDRPLATRPTFAIDLQKAGRPIPTPDDGSYLPQANDEGLARSWTSWDTTDAGGLSRFVGAMISTWQGWVDTEALRMPGYRDRVVTIYSTADEGGMNLTMDDATVQRLADRGASAADKLVTKFTSGFDERPTTGFDNHRWIRLRVALAGLSEWLDAFATDFAAPAPGAVLTHEELLSGAHDLPSYPGGSLTALRELTESLRQLADATSPTSITTGAPHPRGRLRLQPDREARP